MGMHDLYISKNHDYGDSYANIRTKYPTSVLIRIADKLSRLEILMGGNEAKILDEGINDTLTDLANYCVLELVEREVDEQYLKAFKDAQEPCKKEDYNLPPLRPIK